MNLINQFLFSDSRVTLLELMMVNVHEKNLHTSEEMNVFMRHAGFLAGCFQEKYEAVLKLTSAEDAGDEVCLTKNITVLVSSLPLLPKRHLCTFPVYIGKTLVEFRVESVDSSPVLLIV